MYPPDPSRQTLATIPALAADFAALGVQPGMVLVVHSSMRARIAASLLLPVIWHLPC
ncbi:MAG: hypothetical protein ABI835_19485 [Chloroflexota bacterium]